MKNYIYIFLSFAWLAVVSCDPQEDDDFGLGTAPTTADVQFSVAPSAENENILVFTNQSPGFKAIWDFGNGTGSEGDVVRGTYPVEGTYTVTLTIYTSGGSASNTQTVEIAATDPSLLDIPIYNMLTGGPDNLEGKTWVVDANNAGHFGVGPVDGDSPSYYAAPANDKAGSGLYNDEFTFTLDGFGYVQDTKGDVFINTQQAGNFPGAYENAGDFTAPYDANEGLTWTISEGADGIQTMRISNNGFIGYYTGVSTYQILSLEEERMVLKFEDAADPSLAWFETLIPLDVANATPPAPAFSYTINGLQISFTNNTEEADSYTWDFGDNNTSTEESPVHTYASEGMYTITLSATNANGTSTTERTIILATTNTVTLNQLAGDDSKTWKLLPAAGSFGVGPSKGSTEWFGSADISGDRPCLFNDEFIFRTDNKYVYNARGDVFAEEYMGVGDGCIDESTLVGTNAEPWMSGTHDFVLNNSGGPSVITLQGVGAFIALPKAYNGGEYAGAPPTESSVSYEVMFYVNDGENELLGITIDISGVGGSFWSFILKAEN
ncbi:PKD domain-containing protein [Fulvivirga maritima]|uniref:PKD domain-containing protein n=1 Tax=Fulvivirga maritima TaxID=2904247 RepID=UPI00272ECC59|nr:PKD domain-containing protein [Fulvivirga maritima]